MKRLNPLTLTQTRTVPTPFSKDEWRIVECLETGMVYLENPPEYTRLIDEYAWEKTSKQEKIRRKAKEPMVAWMSAWIKKIRHRVRKTEKIETLSVQLLRQMTVKHHPLTLVDIGCAEGTKSCRIANTMRSVYHRQIIPLGVEISQTLCEEAHKKFAAFCGRAIHDSALGGIRQMEDQSIDLVILCSFLEHEIHPLDLLRESGQKLKSSGRIVIKVPNYGSLNRMVRQGRWCGFRYPDHVNYFTPTTLKILIQNAGLQLVRMNFLDRLPISDNLWAVVKRTEP